MKLLSAVFRRFRNLGRDGEPVALEPGRRATVLVGDNGQGKTNTLEGLWFAGTLRPLRASRLSELAQLGTPPSEIGETASVQADFELEGGPRRFGVRLVHGERVAEVDGRRVDSVDSYFGGVTVVAFTPDDLDLAKGPPEGRRRFLDRAVFGHFPGYLGESREYARALRSRNRLLRDKSPAALLEAFDGPLVRSGARVWRRRLDIVDALRPRATQAFEAVGHGHGGLALSYRASGAELDPAMPDEALSNTLSSVLRQRLELDCERGFTSAGPHADDLLLRVAGRPARHYASQGQQRAAVLALKVGEIESLRDRLGRYPLLLLDDVSSELDRERNRTLMEYLRSLDAQVVLTTTDAALVQGAAGDDAVAYRVSAGQLSRL